MQGNKLEADTIDSVAIDAIDFRRYEEERFVSLGCTKRRMNTVKIHKRNVVITAPITQNKRAAQCAA